MLQGFESSSFEFSLFSRVVGFILRLFILTSSLISFTICISFHRSWRLLSCFILALLQFHFRVKIASVSRYTYFSSHHLSSPINLKPVSLTYRTPATWRIRPSTCQEKSEALSHDLL